MLLNDDSFAAVEGDFAEGVLVVHGLGEADDLVEEPVSGRGGADGPAIGVAQAPGRLADPIVALIIGRVDAGVEDQRDRQPALPAQRLEGVRARRELQQLPGIDWALGGRQKWGKVSERRHHITRARLYGWIR